MEVAGTLPAIKLLAQQLSDVQRTKGGQFKLPGLPAFERVWVQGTVKQKLAGTLRLDDGTGAVDCLCGVKDQPGLEIDRCAPGAYVLVQGKVLAKAAGGDRQQLFIKAQKLLNLGGGCGGSAGQRAVMWSSEVQELQRLLQEADMEAEMEAAA